jgi:prenyltransferase beta subunit
MCWKMLRNLYKTYNTMCTFYFLNRLHLMKMEKWTSIADFVIIIKEVMNQLVGIGYIF